MKLKEIFGDWYTPMEPLLNAPLFENIGKALVALHTEGKHILPSFDLMFRPFSLCHPLDIKVVLLLPAPYDIKGYADGLAMSTRAEVTPSWLRHMHRAWEEDLSGGFDLPIYESSNDLAYLAQEGVLLLNAAFTCEPGEPTAHRELWRPFTRSVLQMLSHYYKDLVFIMAGGLAQEFIPFIGEPKHTILTCCHPAAADHIGSTWEHQQVFKRCNNILEAKGIAPIQWYTPALQNAVA